MAHRKAHSFKLEVDAVRLVPTCCLRMGWGARKECVEELITACGVWTHRGSSAICCPLEGVPPWCSWLWAEDCSLIGAQFDPSLQHAVVARQPACLSLVKVLERPKVFLQGLMVLLDCLVGQLAVATVAQAVRGLVLQLDLVP